MRNRRIRIRDPWGIAYWRMGLNKQVEKGDQEVGSAINAWGLLESGLNGIDRNRRALVIETPTLTLFLKPYGKLYQRLIQLEKLLGSIPPILEAQNHPGSQESQHSISLDHSKLKTTSDYLEELTGYENAYASQLEYEFGI